MKLRDASFLIGGIFVICLLAVTSTLTKLQYSKVKNVETLLVHQQEKIPDQIIVESNVPCSVVVDKNNTRVIVSSIPKNEKIR